VTAVVEARQLSRFYEVKTSPFKAAKTLRALSEMSFTLEAGKTLAVVGESGCGKSTLARVVTMIEPPSEGELTIDGIPVATADREQRRRLRGAVQIVFQDPYGSLNPRKKVGAILEEPLKINTDMKSAERRQAAEAMLSKVGLRPEHYDRYPHMFSGGQRQRIAIARALMLRPKVVVADEPVSALDVSIQAQVLNLLMDLQEEFGLAYLFISHGLSVVEHIADDLVVMYLGRPVEHGTKEAIFRHPRHPYTKALLASTPFVDPTKRAERVVLKGELPSPLNPPPGCAFHRRCPYATDVCSLDRLPADDAFELADADLRLGQGFGWIRRSRLGRRGKGCRQAPLAQAGLGAAFVAEPGRPFRPPERTPAIEHLAANAEVAGDCRQRFAGFKPNHRRLLQRGRETACGTPGLVGHSASDRPCHPNSSVSVQGCSPTGSPFG
jgi:dipeptide transport system ATP-binding protein